ncbi:urea transporter [Ferrovibrio xuzhouensis]|uniref:Urea transporter n=1 Tax=Ferrovibrio xuzhouensis TaxID=1576914 RepID=A0ABV7VCM0_9PROT
MNRGAETGSTDWLAILPTRGRVAENSHNSPTPLISILGPALGGAFMIPNPWIGMILWLAVFQNLRFAAFAVLGLIVAESISRMFQIRDSSPIEGGLKANALLSAVAVAWLTGPVAISIQAQVGVAVVAAVSATILTAAVMKALAEIKLPAMVVGYCLIAAMLFAIYPHWTTQAINTMTWWPVPTDLLGWVVTFFRTLGAMLFSPTLWVGLVLGAAVLLWSRMSFLAGVIGWTAGIFTASILVQQGVVFYWMPTAYNFFLAGAALGAVYFLPGPFSLLIAAIGGSGAAFLAVGLQNLFPATALGYLPIASALTTWIGIYALEMASGQTLFQRNRTTELSPEEAWWRSAYWARRSGPYGPFLVVPTPGRMRISQGIDGALSHIGLWRHALDFQKPNPAGLFDPDAAADAASWSVPVTAPAAGIVERIHNYIADNPPGICNYAENWGNHVVIRLDQGGYVLLAHLRQGSVAVTAGMRVEIGTYLGMTGNSGRSPVPHLHMQYQGTGNPDSPTLPFRLANFLSAAGPEQPLLRWHSATIPGQGAIVAPASLNPAVHAVLSSTSPGSAVWNVEIDGIVPRSFRHRTASTTRISVSLDAAGQHLYQGLKGGKLVTTQDADAWRVTELQAGAVPLLKLLALAVPSIPYAASAGMMWEEPAPVVAIGMARWLGLSISPFLTDPFAAVRCRCVSVPEAAGQPLVIETNLESAWSWLPVRLICHLDRLRGPIRLEAVFRGGTITYSLLSFEPGLPYGSAPQ